MSDHDDLGRALGASIQRRVRRVDPPYDTDELIRRIERQHARSRRRLLVGATAAVVVAVAVGYALGDARMTPAPAIDVADGAPRDSPAADTSQPRNVDKATNQVIQAFHDAYDGGTPTATRRAAIQDGARVDALRSRARALALVFGYTQEQLDASSVAVHETRFVDRTHAMVRFTITIPGHGPVISDRIGYAVFDGGRWKVSLRTACDLLSLGGLTSECSPISS